MSHAVLSRGSEWHRWDPHLHAPGTLLSDQFGSDWESYLHKLESSNPRVRALGVTDYFCIGTYREIRKHKSANGRLPDVGLIFPNVEMRLDIKTEKQKPINIHLLFSPDDPEHESEIERLLGYLTFEFQDRTYQCTLPELAKLGRAVDPLQTDALAATRLGASQFKTTLQDLRQLFRKERWMRMNCLVAVASKSSDGTSGLQDDGSYVALRREIESFADIIFSSTPSQRDFWLGKNPKHPPAFIESTYGGLKPCLHGSDSHREATVAAPDLDRYCWLKGDLTFETLRQAVIEPEDRVSISVNPPTHAVPAMSVVNVRTQGTKWLERDEVPLNSGLVAIVGARGSGKTALADIVAAGAQSSETGKTDSSFLRRAYSPIDHLAGSTVELTWGDGSATTASLQPFEPDEWGEPMPEGVRYLSQHFVERLCSAAGLAVELRQEMERVVFERTDPTSRLATESFEELAASLLEPIRRRREDIRQAIGSTTNAIVQEDLLKDRLPVQQKERDTLQKQIEGGQKALATLLPKGNQERIARLTALESACAKAQATVEGLRRRRKALEDLATEVQHVRTAVEPKRFAEMRRRFDAAALPDQDWAAFQLTFKGDVDTVLARAQKQADVAIARALNGEPALPHNPATSPLDQWPLNALTAARDVVKKEVGIDADRQKRYNDLRTLLTQQETSLKRLDEQIAHAGGADGRRRELIDSRRGYYVQAFESIVQEEAVLKDLYGPLETDLVGSVGALSKLAFVVRRRANLDAWCVAGEALLDLRKFGGHGVLQREADIILLPAWTAGTAEQVAQAMEAFRTKLAGSLVAAMPSSVPATERRSWSQSLAAWLYDISHISVQYGIEYEGVAIEQLSPGTRGVVLLLLYLAVDQQDQRPLIVDQPEENLDPNSVFEELVPHFREARKRRQIIVVTHNANLVVNTDADQVIVASSTRVPGMALPMITYKTGSLENGDIRRTVCQILEGGERAFLERERRYRLRWDQALKSADA